MKFLQILIYVGPTAMLVGVAFGIYCFARYTTAPTRQRERSLVAYIGISIAVGVVAYIAGAAIGILGACSSASSSNLCGLVGIFGVGPLLAGLAIAAYAFTWDKGNR